MTEYIIDSVDVVVIGGGHAGAEAALAAVQDLAAEAALAAVQDSVAEAALAAVQVQVVAVLMIQVPALARAPEVGLVPAVLRVPLQALAPAAVCISAVSAFPLAPIAASAPRTPVQSKALVSLRAHPIMKAIPKKTQDFPLKQRMGKIHFPKKSWQEGLKSRESRRKKSLPSGRSF